MRSSASRSGRCCPCDRRRARRAQGPHRAGAAAADRRPLVAAPARSGGRRWPRAGCGCKQRAKARGVELPLVISDHADWDELTATIDEVGAEEIWVTHGREEALVHQARLDAAIAPARCRSPASRTRTEMNRFAALLDALLFTPSRNGKLRLMQEYFATTGRSRARLGAGGADRRARLRRGEAERRSAPSPPRRVDPELLGWSYDFVGDLAETVSLIWPHAPGGEGHVPSLAEIVEQLNGGDARRGPARCSNRWLDALDATGRWALLKLVTGELADRRLGAARQDRARRVERGRARRHRGGLARARAALPAAVRLARGPAPRGRRPAICRPSRPLMLAQPLEDERPRGLDPRDYRAEWKWDGIRVQLVARGGERRLYSRSGDDIGAAFPDICAAMPADVDARRRAAGDARRRGGAVQRSAAAAQPQDPDAEDAARVSGRGAALRHSARRAARICARLSFAERRRRLEAWYARAPRPRSRSVAAGAVRQLGRARASCATARASAASRG